MNAYLFPGQGSQFSGMGLDIYEKYDEAKELFHKANGILGFEISKVMFEGTVEELKETKVTQPAIFIHSVILSKILGEDFKPDMVAGHSLGEFSALVASGVLDFEDGLILVSKRAQAMQEACKKTPSTMAAVLGLEDQIVDEGCKQIDGIVVAANFNCPGQVVISGSVEAVEKACEWMTSNGARRAKVLPVGGAFHSPLMESARKELAGAIESIDFKKPICPIYQNVPTTAITNPEEIKENLITQLTSPVKWTQSIQQMIQDGATSFTEVGPGRVLAGLVKKINRASVIHPLPLTLETAKK